ncbi:MAG: hypothetical protein ABEJ98_02580 [Candidatus Nanohaloarchaea archaeon]
MNLEEIRQQYRDKKEVIDDRLEEFSELKDASDYRLFKELVFVILTSQTSAKKAWKAAEQLDSRDFLLNGNRASIAEVLHDNEIQYEERKASYIVENREKLSQPTLQDPTNELKLGYMLDDTSPDKTREWMVENLKGVGWKAASHFLRNIGFGDVAIVSNYIAEDLQQLGLADSAEIPDSREKYLRAEEKMRELSEELGISVEALDLVLWSMETGEVFK